MVSSTSIHLIHLLEDFDHAAEMNQNRLHLMFVNGVPHGRE